MQPHGSCRLTYSGRRSCSRSYKPSQAPIVPCGTSLICTLHHPLSTRSNGNNARRPSIPSLSSLANITNLRRKDLGRTCTVSEHDTLRLPFGITHHPSSPPHYPTGVLTCMLDTSIESRCRLKIHCRLHSQDVSNSLYIPRLSNNKEDKLQHYIF